jgi:hypothetical protein
VAKLYVVEFTHKVSGRRFQKIGWTKHYEVLDRFTREESIRYGRDPAQYDNYTIKVLASAYSSDIDEVCDAEEEMLKRYPKNLHIEESFSGVTEITNLNPDFRDRAIEDVLAYRRKWAQRREQRKEQIK